MAYRKYSNVRTQVDGIAFPSKREAKRYGELKLLERAGRIRNLQMQVKYPLVVNGIKVCTYIADFVYSEMQPGFDGWANDEEALKVVEDCKGFRTATYRLKAKLLKACHGITIRET